MIPKPTPKNLEDFGAAFDAAWARLTRMSVGKLTGHVSPSGRLSVRHHIRVQMGATADDWLRPALTICVPGVAEMPELRLNPFHDRLVEMRYAVREIYLAYVRTWADARCDGRPFLFGSDEELRSIFDSSADRPSGWNSDYLRRCAVREFAFREQHWRATESNHERLERLAATRAAMDRERAQSVMLQN